MDSQVAQNRMAKSYDQGSKFDSKEPSGMIIGEVSTEQTTENTQNFNVVLNSGAERDPWEDWKDDGASDGLDGGRMYRMGKGGRYFNGTCDNCHQHGHAWRHCPKMSEQDKIAFAAKKGVNYKGATKGGGKDQGGKWGGNGGKGWDYGKGFGNQWSKGWQLSGNRSYGKGFGKKGLNEMGGSGWDLDDVWDLNGIHLLTAGATSAQKDNQMDCHAGAQVNLPVAVHWNPIPTQNRLVVFQETEGDGKNLEPSDSKMQNQFPLMRESIRVLGERANDVQRSMPRAKFPRKNLLKAGRSVPAHTVKPEDVMQLSRAPDEVNRVNSARGLHFLGNLLPTESGIHQVQAVPGFFWKPATSIVDSGAINNVAPSSVSAKALVESNGSLNGMTYHTADGTRIPNLGQKTLETVSKDGSTQLSQTFQVADMSGPLVSVGELADAGNLVVVFGRKGGFIVNPDTGRRLNFQREHGVYKLNTWSQEPVSSTSVFSRQG